MTPQWLPLPSNGTDATAWPRRASSTLTPILCTGGMVDSIAPFIMSTRLLTPLPLRAAAHQNATAVLGRVGDAAVVRLLGRGVIGLDSEVCQHGSQQDVRLGGRERRRAAAQT